MIPHEVYRLTLEREAVDESGKHTRIGKPEAVAVIVKDFDGLPLEKQSKRHALERLRQEMELRIKEMEGQL